MPRPKGDPSDDRNVAQHDGSEIYVTYLSLIQVSKATLYTSITKMKGDSTYLHGSTD